MQGVKKRPGERLYGGVGAVREEFFGTLEQYSSPFLVGFGRPTSTAAILGASLMLGALSKSRAQERAQERWRTSRIRRMPVVSFAAVKRTLLALGIALATVLLSAGTASAAANPYTGNGYDASQYQCSNRVPTPLDGGFTSFAVIRVTGGRPFTADSCRQALWNAAEGSIALAPSLYVNVAYSGAYGHNVSGYCAGLTLSPESYTGSYLKAYRIGCAEGEYAFGHAPAVGAGQKANLMWWLDVETGNSWSSSDHRLNQAAIDGTADRLATLSGVPVGVYSYDGSWNTITTGSGFTPHSASATWVALSGGCGTSFVGALPQWIWQSGSTATGYDADYAC